MRNSSRCWVASRFFVEARHTGELELLLTTPVGAAEIASTQWDVLKRMVTGPLVLMLAPLCFYGLMLYMLGYGGPSLLRLYYPFSLMFSAVNAVLSVGVLCWLGFWFGLRVANQGRAILWTVLLAHGPPYALSLLWSIVYRTFVAASGRALFASPWMLGSLMPQLVTLLLYLWMIHLARRQLLTELAGGEPLSPRQLFGNALPRVATVIRRARRWPAA